MFNIYNSIILSSQYVGVYNENLKQQLEQN